MSFALHVHLKIKARQARFLFFFQTYPGCIIQFCNEGQHMKALVRFQTHARPHFCLGGLGFESTFDLERPFSVLSIPDDVTRHSLLHGGWRWEGVKGFKRRTDTNGISNIRRCRALCCAHRIDTTWIFSFSDECQSVWHAKTKTKTKTKNSLFLLKLGKNKESEVLQQHEAHEQRNSSANSRSDDDRQRVVHLPHCRKQRSHSLSYTSMQIKIQKDQRMKKLSFFPMYIINYKINAYKRSHFLNVWFLLENKPNKMSRKAD